MLGRPQEFSQQDEVVNWIVCFYLTKKNFCGKNSQWTTIFIKMQDFQTIHGEKQKCTKFSAYPIFFTFPLIYSRACTTLRNRMRAEENRVSRHEKKS